MAFPGLSVRELEGDLASGKPYSCGVCLQNVVGSPRTSREAGPRKVRPRD